MSQSLSKVWVHLIFSTKERSPFFKEDETQQQLYRYIKTICAEQHCYIGAIGGTEDHIHLLINMNKNMSLASLVEKIKKTSSKWIKSIPSNRSELKKFFWQRGYGAFSVSESNLEKVKTYIKNQEQHHKKFSFKDELRKFLLQHGVSFDEKYLWD